MPFSLLERPYLIETRSSGLQVARKPDMSISDEMVGLQSRMYWEEADHAETNFYPHLRQWLEPVLAEKHLALKNLFSDPQSLPNMLRELSPGNKLALVVNTFPPMGDKWIYTTRGLNEMGQLKDYAVDSVSEPLNHRVCVPTCLRRLGIIDNTYFTDWKNHIDSLYPDPDIGVAIWTTHMIALSPEINSDTFFIGDQYGIGRITDDQLVAMAQARDSFDQGQFPYHAQVFEPQSEIVD